MRRPRTLSLCLVREVMQYMLLGLAAIGLVMLGRGPVRPMDELARSALALDVAPTARREMSTARWETRVPGASPSAGQLGTLAERTLQVDERDGVSCLRGDIHANVDSRESNRHSRVSFERLECEGDAARTLGPARRAL